MDNLTYRLEIHEHMLHFNQMHFRQAKDTPFGQNGSLAHHIDLMNLINQHNNMLDGTAMFEEGTSPELDQWISELQ